MTPPPLSREDLEAIARLLEERQAAKRPALTRPGLVREESISPELARKFSEEKRESEDVRQGFERMMMRVVDRLEEKVDSIVVSIPPAAKAASGAEDAAVVGAKASIAGANAAIDSKTNALAAKVASHRAIIVQVVVAVVVALWQIYEHFAALPVAPK